MTLDKVDVLYNIKAVDHYNSTNVSPHYKMFIHQVLTYLTVQDVAIIHDWQQVRGNSLIILYEYQGFYTDLKIYSEKKQCEIFRRVFIISDSFRAFYHPYNYKEKSFAGTLYNVAYDFFVQGGGFNKKYPSFYADERAVDTLREKSETQSWRVTETVSGLFGYVVVFNKDNLIKPLAIYFNEYMEKYNELKDIDKFMIEEIESIKKSWWKRIFK